MQQLQGSVTSKSSCWGKIGARGDLCADIGGRQNNWNIPPQVDAFPQASATKRVLIHTNRRIIHMNPVGLICLHSKWQRGKNTRSQLLKGASVKGWKGGDYEIMKMYYLLSSSSGYFLWRDVRKWKGRWKGEEKKFESFWWVYSTPVSLFPPTSNIKSQTRLFTILLSAIWPSQLEIFFSKYFFYLQVQNIG